MTKPSSSEILQKNCAFYDSFPDHFDKIPFENILPSLILKHVQENSILEIGCGTGALAKWAQDQGYKIQCIEPSFELAKKARNRGLQVHELPLQEFLSQHRFSAILAISSLIHIPKDELVSQIAKISLLLQENGTFILSMIEGENEGFMDPTGTGKTRFFSLWKKEELESLLSPFFNLLEKQSIVVNKMKCTFLLYVYQKKS